MGGAKSRKEKSAEKREMDVLEKRKRAASDAGRAAGEDSSDKPVGPKKSKNQPGRCTYCKELGHRHRNHLGDLRCPHAIEDAKTGLFTDK